MNIFSFRIRALLGALIFFLAGCGDSSDPPSSQSTITSFSSPNYPNCLLNASTPECQGAKPGPPYVIYTSRSDGAMDAAVNTDIVAVFSEPLNPSSVSTGSLIVTDDENKVVPGFVTYDGTRNALIFHQSQDLTTHRYTATVAANVQDLEGNKMGSSYSWSFTVDPARRDTSQQLSIQQILDKAAYTYQIPGSIIAIRDNQGKTWSTTNGYANLATRTPTRTNMRFRVGSNTKTYVATVILQLVDAGKVNLDDPVNKYLSAEMTSYMPAYDGNRITIRHLLNHTSGIANFTIDNTWGDAFISDPFKQYFPQELLMIANGLANAPGAPQFGNFYYSNTNYVLLGLIIRKASGLTYEDAVANGITISQGLSGTTIPRIGDATLPLPYSNGYWEDTETNTLHDVTFRDASTVWSSGDIISTISDLARWGELLGKGSLLSSGTQAQRLQFVPMTDNLSYGLGIVKDNGANLLGHQGGMIGYTSQTYYMPDTGYTLAFFYNRTLALHDYSVVMTYDTIRVLWPDRQNVTPSAASLQPRVFSKQKGEANNLGRPGFLTEY